MSTLPVTGSEDTGVFCSWTGFWLGARMMLTVIPSLGLFAVAVGTLSAQKGMGFGEFLLFQGFVFAGMSQLVALGFWEQSWSLAALFGVMAVTFTINSRMILMGAALQPWLNDEPFWRKAFSLFFITDVNWIFGMRYHAQGGRDAGILIGSGVCSWIFWMAVGCAGYFAGSFISNPRIYGLDMFMPVFFVIMVTPLWKGRRETLSWGIAGIVAILLHRVSQGFSYIIFGALAGILVAAFLPEETGDE